MSLQACSPSSASVTYRSTNSTCSASVKLRRRLYVDCVIIEVSLGKGGGRARNGYRAHSFSSYLVPKQVAIFRPSRPDSRSASAPLGFCGSVVIQGLWVPAFHHPVNMQL